MISVGNLAVGGRGKTPLVAALARLLAAAGERPAVLTRGYARRNHAEGVVVVRTPDGVNADLDSAGDEPLMLARQLDGCAVLVSPDRYLAGRLAESRLGCTVHVLDDGFQHVGLARDVDLVLVSEADVGAGAVLPAGRLRESIDAVRAASAIVVPEVTVERARDIAARLGVERAFASRRVQGVPRLVEPFGQAPRVPRDAPVVAVAAIADPGRFFDDLRQGGWNLAATLVWRDHHLFGPADVDRIEQTLARTGAELVLTTEKDLMRLLPLRPVPFPLAWVPLSLDVEPAGELARWLRAAVSARPLAGSPGW